MKYTLLLSVYPLIFSFFAYVLYQSFNPVLFFLHISSYYHIILLSISDISSPCFIYSSSSLSFIISSYYLLDLFSFFCIQTTYCTICVIFVSSFYLFILFSFSWISLPFIWLSSSLSHVYPILLTAYPLLFLMHIPSFYLLILFSFSCISLPFICVSTSLSHAYPSLLFAYPLLFLIHIPFFYLLVLSNLWEVHPSMHALSPLKIV